MRLNIFYIRSALLFSFFFLSLSCSNNVERFEFSGKTMGTYYKVVIVGKFIDPNLKILVKDSVESTLRNINSQMSTYDSLSVISKINFSRKGEKIFLPYEIRETILLSKKISELSEGAFDITVMPLVNEWGFGPKKKTASIPDDSLISNLLRYVGLDKYEIVDTYYIVKKYDEVKIDLSAIAKGYGVDAVGKTLESLGFSDFLVEIGGEVLTKGKNEKNKDWKIGIDKPELDNFNSNQIQKVIELSNMAVATSGNYRNYYYYNNKFYSHAINPKNGKPVEHNLASVTIIAPSCAFADALATAVLVMGTEKGLKLINNLNDVECYLIERIDENNFKEYFSSGFNKFLSKVN